MERPETFEILIRNGLWFDGKGSPPAIRDLGIRAGRVAAVSETPLDPAAAEKVIDARGLWVMPGFLDVHTHYDAEILVAPGLGESVRHGVTTVALGSCSLSTVHSTPLDCADLFSRVEAVPRPCVLATLEKTKTWSSAAAYAEALDRLPLGPNVAAFIGHSDLRTATMGLGRATDAREVPTGAELERMDTLLTEALDAGYLGLSMMEARFDKLDGERYRSRTLPSTFTRHGERARLARTLRRRGRVLQSAPNIADPMSIPNYFLASLGALRRSLKVSLLTAADAKALPFLATIITTVTGLFNRWLGTNIRWQHLPVPFEVYSDGIDLVVFEELGAGGLALHLTDPAERKTLFANEDYRRRFRREYDQRFSPRVWQRDFHDATIVSCPDATIIGKTIGDTADRRGQHPVDAFLDLVIAHGTRLRWRTVIANHRPAVLDRLSAHPTIQMGFADSGAHLRNMAFYNFPVRLLKRVKDAQEAGRPFLTLERAVHRLTGELADWYGLAAGTLRAGDRADVVIVDPAGLDESVDGYYEAPIAEFGDLSRMVNRSDRAIRATIIAGQVAYEAGSFAPGFGTRLKLGRFLRAGEERAAV